MAVSFNGVSTYKQPRADGLVENYQYARTEGRSLSNLLLRNTRGKTKFAELMIDWLTPAEYQAYDALAESDAMVTYLNPSSKHPGGSFTFNGLVTMVDDGAYHPGTNLYSNIKIRIEE